MSIELKEHNQEAYEKVKDTIKNGNRAAVIHPTGTGKSYIALKLLEENKGKKVIYLAPSNSILHNIKRNIFDAGMDMTDFPELTRMTYAKLMRMNEEEIAKLGADIIVLDEFHHCGAPEWGNGVKRLLQRNPNATVLGLSATPIRYLDNARDMAEELFGENIASEMTLEEAIDQGILPEATYVSALYSYKDQLDKMQQDIDKIENSERREEAQRLFGELKGKLDESTENLPELLSQYMTNKSGKYIVFCKNIEDMKQKMQSAQEMFGGVNSSITTYSISSENDIRLNDRTLSAFEQAADDSLKLMFAVDMLNEGYHISDLDGVVMMRPTFSPTIFAQQLGRALSVKKEDGKAPVILDLVDNFDSCKVIEDFCERMKQYKGRTGDGRSNAPKKELTIFDKTKEFREIANRITVLRRGKVFLEEKIEIFNRFSQTGEELTGQTIFEGHPIGQWATQIRSLIKNNRSGLNASQAQMEQLIELGILDRKIDTTIDEKIEELVEWNKKYSKATVVGEARNIEDILRSYASSDEEYKLLLEQYERMKRHYDYIRARKSNGKLTSEQENACKEGNVRGVFGYPTKTEELAKSYRINPDKIDYILCKYGNMENFVEAYITNRTPGFEEDGPLKDNIIFNIPIDTTSGTKNKVARYLYRDILEGDGDISSAKRILTFFDGEEVLNNLYRLSPKEEMVMRLRLGLVDGNCHSLEEIGRQFNITRERVRQVIFKSIRKLSSRDYRERATICVQDDSDKNNYSPEEIEQIEFLMDKIYRSNLIFVPDKEYEEEPDSISSSELNEIAVQLQDIQQTRTQRMENENIVDSASCSQDIGIDELNFSVLTYNILKRSQIETISQLRALSDEELLNIRHMRPKVLEEIRRTLKQLNSNEQVAEIEGEGTQEIETTATNDSSNSGQTSTSQANELENLRAMRDSLAEEVEKLRQQTKSAEQLLSSYDAILKGTTQDNSQNTETKG